jgi:hypothetical protein
MLLEFFAPQGLKGMAAAIQGVEFSGSGPLTAQIAPSNFVGRHPCVFSHVKIYEFVSNFTGLSIYIFPWKAFQMPYAIP